MGLLFVCLFVFVCFNKYLHCFQSEARSAQRWRAYHVYRFQWEDLSNLRFSYLWGSRTNPPGSRGTAELSGSQKSYASFWLSVGSAPLTPLLFRSQLYLEGAVFLSLSLFPPPPPPPPRHYLNWITTWTGAVIYSFQIRTLPRKIGSGVTDSV